jgi:hypothetical protein
MKRKLAFALVSAATLAVVPAFAQDSTSSTTTTTTAEPTTTTTTASSTATTTTTETTGDKSFGDPGVIAIGAGTELGFAATSSKFDGNDAGKSTRFGLTADVSYFVIKGLSVGGLLGFQSLSTKDAAGNDAGGATTIAIGPQVGYNIDLSPPTLSLWPKASFLYESTSTKQGGNDGPKSTKMVFGLFVPLMIHPVKHFAFGIGPFLDMDISSKSKPPVGDEKDGVKDMTFGLKGVILGWL